MKSASYDVGDAPDRATSTGNTGENRNHLAAIASRTWGKINEWQKKAENAAVWLDSIASGKRPSNVGGEVQQSDIGKDVYSPERINDGVPFKNLTLPIGSIYSSRYTPSLSAKSQTSSASSSRSVTPKISAKSISSSGPSSPESGIASGHTFWTNRHCVSPFPDHHDSQSSPYHTSSMSPSLSKCDGATDFVKVSKALRHGWRWLVCRYMMRQAGSESVRRLLSSCGVQVPSTPTTSDSSTDNFQMSEALENNAQPNGPTVILPVINTAPVGTAAVSEIILQSNAARGNPSAVSELSYRKQSEEMLACARLQRKTIIKIVSTVRTMAMDAGMTPPSLAVRKDSATSTSQSNKPSNSNLAVSCGRSSSKFQISPSSIAAAGPTDSMSSKLQSPMFSWDNVADMFHPLKPKGTRQDSEIGICKYSFDGKPERTVSSNSSESSPSKLLTYAVSSVEGHTYEGEFSHGKMHGYGRLVWPDGHWYQGQFDNENTRGIGLRGWPSGHWYVGEEHAGLKAGLGAMSWPGGRRYEGRFKNDLRDGFGLMMWPNGRWYAGWWKDGLQHGEGVEGGEGALYFVQNDMGSKQLKARLDNMGFFETEMSEFFRHDFQAQISTEWSRSSSNANVGYVAGDDIKQCVATGNRIGRRRATDSYKIAATASDDFSGSAIAGFICSSALAKSCHTQNGENPCRSSEDSPKLQDEKECENGTNCEASAGSEEDDEESIDVSSSLEGTDSDEPSLPIPQTRVRTSERVLEMIQVPRVSQSSCFLAHSDDSAMQGGSVTSMVDDDDEDEPSDASSRDQCVSRMLAERLVAESSRSCGMQGQPGVNKGRRVGPSSPGDTDADPQFPLPSVQSDPNAAKALWQAAAGGDSAGVSRALRKSGTCIVHMRDENDGGNTAIIKAARAGCCSAVCELIRAHADPGDRDGCGCTAIHVAASGGHRDVIDTLVRAGAKVDDKCEAGETALHKAAMCGMAPICAALVALGADANAPALDGGTPLHRCATAGHVAVGRALVRLGARVGERDGAGLTAQEAALACGQAAWAEAVTAVVL